MLLAIPKKPKISLSSFRKADIESITGNREPSLRIHVHARSSISPNRTLAINTSNPPSIGLPNSSVKAIARC